MMSRIRCSFLEKWFGQLTAMIRAPWEARLMTARGLLASPQMRPPTGPKRAGTRRSPTVGMSLRCRPKISPSGPRKSCVLYRSPGSTGSRSHRPTTAYTRCRRAARQSASVAGLGISTALSTSSRAIWRLARLVAAWKWYHTGWAGMKPSGNTTSSALPAAAFPMRSTAFARLASRSRKAGAAWTAAMRTVGHRSPIAIASSGLGSRLALGGRRAGGRRARRALTQRPQEGEGIDPRHVAVRPGEAEGVRPHRGDLAGHDVLRDCRGVQQLVARPLMDAQGAGAPLAEHPVGVPAGVAVAPRDPELPGTVVPRQGRGRRHGPAGHHRCSVGSRTPPCQKSLPGRAPGEPERREEGCFL